jgi:hypothetical protein
VWGGIGLGFWWGCLDVLAHADPVLSQALFVTATFLFCAQCLLLTLLHFMMLSLGFVELTHIPGPVPA